REGHTILLTTHYMEEAERLCERVAIMDRGNSIAMGTPRELIASIGAEHMVEFYKLLGGGLRDAGWQRENLSKNRLKRVIIRQKREPVSLDAPIRTDDGEVMPDPPSKEPSVLDRMERQDVKRAVQDCIQALEPDFREVLVLRDMQDFSYDEIGGMLKVAAGTVKSRLFRARESVKECLKKAMGSF
ncbi:MAG: sigma-70 family RNA polymerase sigma factor, partial [Nitrospirae bacterium]|nr:sigma-70 family RNA polymerase sigma factor [Nitrospirota bacterium]